jgi:endonuclease-3
MAERKTTAPQARPTVAPAGDNERATAGDGAVPRADTGDVKTRTGRSRPKLAVNTAGKAATGTAPKPKTGAKTGTKTGAKAGRARKAPKPLNDADVAEVFRRFHAAVPEPKGELEHVNAYTLLVAVVLSAQATDAGVNKATRALFAVADTPQKMLALGEDAVREHIKTIGLFRNKAKNVMLLSEQLIRDHGGDVPADRDALTKLPGVGRKTANVVLNMAFGQATMAVDTHVFRVANRLPLVVAKTPDKVEEALLPRIPPAYALYAHHWLILHGRYVCKARAPECHRCLIYDLCRSLEKRPPGPLPLAPQASPGMA